MSDRDSRKTPPQGTPSPGRAKSARAATSPGLPGSSDAKQASDPGEQRDAQSYEAHKERERERLAVPGSVRGAFDQDITGTYSGEELAFMRASERSLPERVGILEVKADSLRDELAGLRLVVGDARLETSATRVKVDQISDRVTVVQAAVGDLKGQLNGQDRVLEKIAADAKRAADKEHVMFTKQVEIEGAGAIARVNVQEAQALTGLDITKQRELAAFKIRRERYKLAGKIAVLLGAGGGLWKLIEALIRGHF